MGNEDGDGDGNGNVDFSFLQLTVWFLLGFFGDFWTGARSKGFPFALDFPQKLNCSQAHQANSPSSALAN